MALGAFGLLFGILAMVTLMCHLDQWRDQETRRQLRDFHEMNLELSEDNRQLYAKNRELSRRIEVLAQHEKNKQVAPLLTALLKAEDPYTADDLLRQILKKADKVDNQ